MAEMTPKQIAAYHAAMGLRDFAQGRARAARNAAQQADSQEGRDYQTGAAEWWEAREKAAQEIIQKAERQA